MSWILLIVSIAGFALAFSAKSAGLLGLGLLCGFGGLLGSFIAFAASRVASAARPDAALLSDSDINALRASVRKAAQQPSSTPGQPAT